MNFTTDRYVVIRNAISRELVDFCFNYFMIKRQAVGSMYKNKIHAESPLLGYWRDMQVPGVYSHYADMVMETLLVQVIPKLNEHSGLNLLPTYSYARVYQNGSELKKHKDRPSCEISATMNLGGDPWSIFIEEKETLKKVKIDLGPGDLLLYAGCELAHWRDKFKGKVCAQVFLHYNDRNGPFGDKNLYDKRPMLGYPKLESAQ